MSLKKNFGNSYSILYSSKANKQCTNYQNQTWIFRIVQVHVSCEFQSLLGRFLGELQSWRVGAIACQPLPWGVGKAKTNKAGANLL